MNPEFGNLEQPQTSWPKKYWCDAHQVYHAEAKCPDSVSEAERRKQQPLATGCLDYFGDALLAVANCSYVGNAQHNGEGTPLRWAREKSTDEPDALLRHLKDRGKIDTDGVRHSAKVAWRALALLQKELEQDQ